MGALICRMLADPQRVGAVLLDKDDCASATDHDDGVCRKAALALIQNIFVTSWGRWSNNRVSCVLLAFMSSVRACDLLTWMMHE
eukprot:8539699-Pyramimonas_sp.AAC.1